MNTAAASCPPRSARDPAGVTGVIVGPGLQCVMCGGMPESIISYRYDNGAWLDAAEDHALAAGYVGHPGGRNAGVECVVLEARGTYDARITLPNRPE